MSFLLRRVAGPSQASPSRPGMASPAYLHASEIETGIVFCRETLIIQNERARSVAGLRKLSETPKQTGNFAGRATSAGSTPRGPNNEISKRDWSGRYRPCDPNPRAHHFLVDGPASAGVAAPPLLSSALIIAAALSRPVPWPPVDTTVCGTSRPISETISGLS